MQSITDTKPKEKKNEKTGRENHTFCGKKQIKNDEKNLIIGAFKRFSMQIRTNTVA